MHSPYAKRQKGESAKIGKKRIGCNFSALYFLGSTFYSVRKCHYFPMAFISCFLMALTPGKPVWV